MKKLVWILSLCVLIVNIFGVLQIFSFSFSFYKAHFSPIEISQSNILNVGNVYDFLQDKNPISAEFTESEYKHLDDVKTIFNFIYFVFRISLFLFAGLSIYLISISKYSIVLNWLILWSIVSLLLMLFLMLFSVLDFQSTFNLFHELFFPQWNRSFQANSLLIQLFPESFFVSISRYIFLTISGISVFVMTSSIILKRILK